MKYFLPLTLLLVVLLVSNCKSHIKLQNFELKNINASIKIPPSYILVNPDTLKKRISRGGDSSFLTNTISSIFYEQGTFILADSTNYSKLILISPIKNYIEIDSNSFYIAIDYQRKTFNKMYDNDSAYFYGSKMGSVGNIKYIDSEYIKSSEDSTIQCIYNSYIISTDNKSLGICFYSPNKQNVSTYINTIVKK